MLNVLDLFCGCGGLSTGFHKNNNFQIICANDIWKDALETYKLNNPNTKTILGDISNDDIKTKILDEFQKLSCDIIIGGPPCQSFSMAGKRDKNDPRGKLFEQYIQLVKELNPKICIIENVKGILSMKHYKDNITPNEKKLITKYEDSECKDSLFQSKIKEMYNKENLQEKKLIKKYEDWKNLEKQIIPYYEKVIDKIMKQFKKLGYQIEYKVLDSSLFGVPQKRERVIFIASRFDCDIVFPMPTNTTENMKTVKEAIDDLKNMNENNKWSHIFSNHCDDVIKKIQNTKIGESMNKKYNDAFFKCDPNKPSRTVKENHGGVFLHYEKNRVMTPRELARLQSFNDDFLFYGTKSSILKQIGNAVPPKLSEHLAQIILQMLSYRK